MKHIHSTIIGGALMTFFLSAQMAGADTVDDFESYGNDSALQSVWFSGLGSPNITLETSVVDSGSKSMKMAASYTGSAVALASNRFSVAQDWSAATSASIRFLGLAGNDASANIQMQLLDSTGQLIANSTFTNGPVQTTWSDLVMPLGAQTGLDDVRTIQLVVVPFFTSFTVYFDNLEVSLPTVNASLIVTETGGGTAVTEGITNETLQVSLESMPANNVTVTPVFSSELVVTPSSTVIPPASWNNAQVFSVAAKEDQKVEGLHSGTVSFTSSSLDGNYDNISTSNIVVSITDNDSLVQPQIETVMRDGTNLRFTVQSDINQRYDVESSSAPPYTNWTKRINDVPGTGDSFNFPIPMNESDAIIRVLTEPAL